MALITMYTNIGLQTLAGLVVSDVKDIHGEYIREGDIIHVKEFKNMVKERVEAAGGEFWTKDGKVGKDHDSGFEIFSKDELKGELTSEYDAKVVWSDNSLWYEHIKGDDVGAGDPITTGIDGTRVYPLSDFEIISRQSI